MLFNIKDLQEPQKAGWWGSLGRFFPSANGCNCRRDIVHGALEIVIDDKVIVFSVVAHFIHCFFHAPGDCVAVLTGAFFQAYAQLIDGRWEYEYTDCRAELCADPLCPLPVDLEHYVITSSQLLFDPLSRSAIAVIEDCCAFYKEIVRDHFLESRDINKMVVDSIGFAGALWTSRVGDGNREAVETPDNRSDQTGFAGARGCRDDEKSLCHVATPRSESARAFTRSVLSALPRHRWYQHGRI